ncbi:mid1-interacting protein 1A isoform X5 [Procambarus clarkii]|uniref:mid1-interacting protein 1A isoform X5 n=1 Tax=Procambarus clarkii TaxID=6728 RepID=UPI001E677D9F|nr:mid1-interacting protein 1A-like isoform X1 [Procambarus clarkii]
MPSQPKRQVALQTNTMLYNSVDNYYPAGTDDNSSVRMNKHDELSDFSSQSILCAMDRFVKAVNNMNETVMVPCRLLDVDVDPVKASHKVPTILRGGGNPYNFYTVLNSVKNDLIWGPTSNDDDDNENGTVSTPVTNTARWSDTSSVVPSTGHVKGHMRRQSTLSMISMSSNTSDGESEGGCDVSEGGDSGVEGEEGSDVATNVMDSLRTHLMGLHSCLNHLTDMATYITDRYQEEVNA